MLCDYYGVGHTYQENLLAKYYSALGHTVVVIASTNESITDFINGKHNNSAPKRIDFDGEVKILRLPYKLNVLGKIRSFQDVPKIIEDEKPDIIYAHDIYFNLHQAAKYKREKGKKLILDYHADYTNSAKNWLSLNILHKLIRKPYFNTVKKNIDKIYPVVPESAKFLNEVYDVPYHQMEVLPLGCDYMLIHSVISTIDKTKEREKLGIGENHFVILNGGKFSAQKRTLLAIEALKKLDNPNIHLLIFGKPEQGQEAYYEEMQKHSRNLNVHYLGWITAEESYKYMGVSDLALFPASQSVLWQQCIGAHLPVIAGDVGQQDMEYLNLHSNLIKVNAQDINADYFASLIQGLYSNPVKLAEMRNGAKKTAEEFLDYRKIAEKTLSDVDLP